MINKYELIELAKKQLRGEDIDSTITFHELYAGLIKYEQFGYATEILLTKIEENEKIGESIPNIWYQQLAINIYKDSSLSGFFKFDKAMNILKSHCNLEQSQDCETLGIAGAIYKYKWKFDHQFHHLLQSRAFYKKGYQIWKKNTLKTDMGHTALNYAYINELLAIQNLEHPTTDGVTDEVLKRFSLSQSVRKEIIAEYVNKNHEITMVQPDVWLYATLAEAYFGTRQYEMAIRFITLYIQSENEKWKIKTFAQQFYRIASFQEIEKTNSDSVSDVFLSSQIDEKKQNECFLALEKLNKEEEVDLDCIEFAAKKEGKVGIGLSGGGFRASLFHIGVLAGLAEKDKLKDIEVISCVSGGSIIGAYYYLKLKHLLQTKEDNEITKEDYIDIVKEMEIDFQNAVEKNLRVMIFTNLFKNIKMFWTKKYSRSHRLGELYEEYFYLPLYKKYFSEAKAIYMNDLCIKPKNKTDFNIYNDNWKRRNKIPQLVLNATCLNTGHNWQFTASWMGEPSTYISDDFDVKPRLRRMYYQNAPEIYKKFRLGYAVAASSCVPVLFEPLLLQNMYDGIDLELVDGGVHDNQGVVSILEQECSSIIISDGSAQMANSQSVVANELSLFFRVDTIVQERVREIQLLDLKSRKYTGSINQLYILHLKNGLSKLPVSWINCTDVNRKLLNQIEIEDTNALLDYGVMKKVQQMLSEVRTDLDSFNQLESYALMYSGYQQTIHQVDYPANNFQQKWKFKDVASYCTLPEFDSRLIKQLKASSNVPFKIVRLFKPFQYIIFLLLVVATFFVLKILYENWYLDTPLYSFNLTYKLIGTFLLILLINSFSKFLSYLFNFQSYIKRKIIYLALIFIGFILFNTYLLLFNTMYNKLGKVA
ncbi:patatin-like phospholipase family protein [Flavobacterium cellulosilyticum]|uniref:PNPLA domain-containing protein n=1 Tax=Flavobacterium cellulosilyticum TaxID=2541731 RepID=A0A4V6PF66_9FLAO|nr:patatin-like phospholipase family protein [Flavobacterium cellulosilyticum]TDD93607.1 hypothetical protein E0F76_18850 [Flavobacterium cellulosilyticum]